MPIKFVVRRVSECPVNSMFLWGGGMWTVVSHDTSDGQSIVRQIGAGWTNNPGNQWQYLDYGKSTFQDDCPVWHMEYDPTVPSMP